MSYLSCYLVKCKLHKDKLHTEKVCAEWINELIYEWMNLLSQHLTECLVHTRCGINGYIQHSKHVSIYITTLIYVTSQIYHQAVCLSQNPFYLLYLLQQSSVYTLPNPVLSPEHPRIWTVPKNPLMTWLILPLSQCDPGIMYTCSYVIATILNKTTSLCHPQSFFNLFWNHINYKS